MFSGIEIEDIVKLINYHYSMMISTSIGIESLSPEEVYLLQSFGVNIDELRQAYPPYIQMFLLGRLTSILGDAQARQLTNKDFKKYIERGQFVPLSERERAEYTISRQMTYSYLKGLANKVTDDTRNKLLEQNKMQLIQQIISQGVKDRKSIQSIVSDLGHKTGEWDRDWKRIVVTEMNNIFQQGRAALIQDKYGIETLVYKNVFPLACRHCIKLYLTNGLGSQPRLFRLVDLINNGSNIGRKVDEWRPTLSSTHPYCFSNPRTPIYTSKGWVFIRDIKVGDLVLTHKGRFKKVTELFIRRSLFKNIEGGIYKIKLRLSSGKFILLDKITSEHPVLSDKGWVRVSDLVIGSRLMLLDDLCGNKECSNRIEIYHHRYFSESADVGGIGSLKYCSKYCCSRYTAIKQWENPRNRELVSVASKRQMINRYKNMGINERRELTTNGRKVVKKMIKDGTHPFTKTETIVKANRSNGKKCSFIELKLRHFLDRLGISYKIGYSIFRDEFRSNGQRKLYFPDIYIPELNIVIEADGENWHEDIEYDKKRDSDIKRLIGADTFRFTESQIRDNGDFVYEELGRIIKNHRGEYGFQDIEVVGIHKYSSSGSDDITLYNFSVEEDESYIANGVVVHNCRCTLNHVHKGQQWDEQKQVFDYTTERERKVIRQSKIKLTVGDKVFLV